ncbi:hypothetical protein CDL12_29097 [Handroanthus impetiginosus]|uniref:Uncharacterized protein n=1 Tax=Handroanthus impetiginosus TaxID=429701 RepID=A0A2G9FZF4_9LAMI|nr:hypothetical protein CDL12_29097 [Handroanthus impetiginosus]
MKTGGAARCLRILRSTTIVKLGSVWRIIRSQLIVPSTSNMQILVINQLQHDHMKRKRN